ncbi:unnamed protein product [Brugia timori]|uniref:SH2 domain-containing protein n=1 Tax=Brugia timori TaxID=42155 RepID=A0A0R3QMY3_9BILA|nr:unnamed protein product [Brugia timori]
MSMLQQILDQMFVDPEILEALDEEQKQILFIKMREEQVKRWKIFEDKREQEDKPQSSKPKNNSRRVRWLKGEDGKDWVWVMGEHKDDLTIEQITEKRAYEEARELAEKEMLENQAVQVEAEVLEKFCLMELNDGSGPVFGPHENEDTLKQQLSRIKPWNSGSGSSARNKVQLQESVYDDADSLFGLSYNGSEPSHIAPASESPYKGILKKSTENFPLNNNSNKKDKLSIDIDIKQKTKEKACGTYLSTDTVKTFGAIANAAKPAPLVGLSHSVKQFTPAQKTNSGHVVKFRPDLSSRHDLPDINDEITKRQSEIFEKIKEKYQQFDREAEQEARRVEQAWEEQERRAREAEAEIRHIAQRAREQHRQQTLRTSAPFLAVLKDVKNTASVQEILKNLPRPPKPKSREAIIDWFKSEELRHGTGLDPLTHRPAVWFHGIITRNAADELLQGKPSGSFLVRVSERIWGYTLSYMVGDGNIKHFMIEKIPQGYQFLGINQVVHQRLHELVAFHEISPITSKGNEILRWAVGQVDTNLPDYADLIPVQRNTLRA